jgi:sulfur carrier protein ThiS
MNYEKYIGIPYAEKGRNTTGLDCYGLVRLIYKEEFKIDLPSFTTEYTQNDTDRIAELIAQYKEGWEQLDEPQEGSIVLFRIRGSESHVGVVVSPTHFIHVRENQDCVIEVLNSTAWTRRRIGYFKYSEKKNAVLNAVPHPLRTERYTIPVPPGTSLEVLAQGLNKEYKVAPELKSKVTVLVNGFIIPQEKWKDYILCETDVIEYRAVPKGDIGRLVLVLAVAYFAPYLAGMAEFAYMGTAAATVAGSTAVYAAAYGAALIIGTSLINAIAPIRPPSMGSQNDPGSAERQLMVNGGSNQINPYGSIPVVLGKVRMTPMLGSVNYLTYENERDSYLSMLLVWGYGPLSIDDTSYKIGDVPLSSFTDYNKITLDRKTEPSESEKLNFDAIYGKDVTQINTAVELTCDGNPEGTVIGYTDGDPIYEFSETGPILVGYEQVPIYSYPPPGPWFEAATGIEYDVSTGLPVPVTNTTIALHFPQGLRRINTQGDGAGNSYATSVDFRAEYSTDVGLTWNLLEEFSIGGDSVKKDGFTYTKSYSTLNHEQLIIRVRRETGDNVEDNSTRRYYFQSVLQSVTFLRNNKPAVDPVGSKIAKTAFKIKATDQLNGNIQGISAIVQTWCKTWNGSAWVEGTTSNPAALVRYILEHPANPRKVTDANAQINLTQLQYFHEYCTARGFEYNGTLGEARSVLEVIRDICAAGRASPALVDGKWTVVIDEVKPNVVQHFTPHNSWGFEGSKALPKRPDGLRVTYYDQDQDYQQSEIIVYDIGKTANNASLFESITLPGVTKKSLVIDHARWHMAQMKLRPEMYTLNSDIEYLVCNRGDRVKVMHDVPMWGLGSGRVKNRISSTILELDEEVPMQAGVQYIIRFRSKSGASVVREIALKTTDDYYSEIELNSAVTTDEADIGDLFLFGQNNQEAQDLILLGIEPSSNNNARLTFVDYGVTSEYNIYTDYQSLTASTVFESQLSLPPALQMENFGASIPLITGFVSDESVMERVSKNVFKYNLNVSYVNASALPTSTESIEVQYDLFSSDSSVNFRSVFVPYQNGSATITDVKEGETYKIRMRYISRTGRVGNWTSYSNHTVTGKTNPPSTVTEFAVSADKSSGQLSLSWHPNLEYDVSTYEIRIEDAGWGVEDYRRVFYGDVTKTFTKYATNGSATFYIRAVDTSGNYSLVSSSVTFTPAAVANVTDIEYSYSDTALTSATVTLNWLDVTNSQFDIEYYEISYDLITRTTKSNSITLPADWVGNRTFTIKTVDMHGNKSSGYSESVTKFAPNPPFDFRAQVIDNNVMLYWTLPDRTSLPIDHVLIKKGSDWNTAVLVGDKKGAFTTINESQGGEYTYWIAAVDTEDVESTPVAVTTLVSEPPDFVFHGEFTSDFSATKSSAYLENNRIVLPVNTTETFQEHFTSNSWSTPQDQVTAGYPVYIQPSESTGYYEEVFDFGQPLASSRVSLSYRGTVVSGTPTVIPKISLSLDNSTYIDYNGATDVYGLNFQYVKIRITASSSDGLGLYEINDLSVRLDAKLKNDAGSISALSTDTLGSIVNFNKEFIDIQSITLSPSGTTPIMPVYDVKDSFVTGTYSVTSNSCTVTISNHGMITGQSVKLFANTGSMLTGVYTITSYTTNTFTVAMTVSDTSGNCSMYPQSFRVYLFNNSGSRVSSTTSWSIKGY